MPPRLTPRPGHLSEAREEGCSHMEDCAAPPGDMPGHTPAGHPRLPEERTGVLVANLGTPDGYDYWSMRRYLNEFLSDRRVIDYAPWKWQPLLQLVILSKRPFTSGANYRSIWNHERNESPLMTITRAQTEKLTAAMAAHYGPRVRVEFCMRYGSPSTPDAVRKMVADGCTRILFFPLYPHYAGATSATANDQFFRALMKEKRQPSVRTVREYFDRPLYIEALAQSVERVYAGLGVRPDVLVASYHGMPKRYLVEGDPYHCQCQKTSRLLRERLGWEMGSIDTAFQSVFGPEEWLRPYTVEHVAELAKSGRKRIAVISPAFSADCIETLEEIDGEIREAFLHAGGDSFTYIPCLNDDDAHIDALVEVIEANLAGWGV
ncbi:MAG: ferrochelatase [Paracoccaceae bacterium]